MSAPREKIPARALQVAQMLAGHFNAHARLDTTDDGRRMDADETNALALQLESMRAKVWEDKYPPIKARRYIPVYTGDDPAAETVAFETAREVGQAKIMVNLADDLPSVETSSGKDTRRVVSLGDSYHYSIQDLRRAAFMNKPLNARKAIAARRAAERLLDQVAAVGAPDAGIPHGFVNNSSVPVKLLAAAGTWASKVGTPLAILNDLNKLIRDMITDTSEAFVPNVILMPTAQMLLISQTKLSTDSDDTVLTAFLRHNPMIESVDMWNRLDGAGGAGADRIVAFQRDPEVAELIVPQDFEVMPPQPQGLSFKVPCHLRTAGTVVYRPLGMSYMDGV